MTRPRGVRITGPAGPDRLAFRGTLRDGNGMPYDYDLGRHGYRECPECKAVFEAKAAGNHCENPEGCIFKPTFPRYTCPYCGKTCEVKPDV